MGRGWRRQRNRDEDEARVGHEYRLKVWPGRSGGTAPRQTRRVRSSVGATVGIVMVSGCVTRRNARFCWLKSLPASSLLLQNASVTARSPRCC